MPGIQYNNAIQQVKVKISHKMQDHKLLQTPLLPVFSKFFIKGTATVGSCCLTFALGPLENHSFFSKKFIYMRGFLPYVSQNTVLILKREFSMRNVPEENATNTPLRFKGCLVEVSNNPCGLKYCFLGGRGSICGCQHFQELYLQTTHGNVHFS